MNFTTKLSGYDVCISDPDIEGEEEMEGAFSVEWDFATEMREWGVKDVSVYATRVKGVIYKNDESTHEWERTEIDSDHKDWVIFTDTSELEFASSICPQDIYVDLKSKIINVNF